MRERIVQIVSAWPSRFPPPSLAVLFLLSLPAVTPRLYASDEIQYFAYLRSLWFDRDLSFENEYRYFYDHGIARAHRFRETFLELETPTGRRYNFGTIGCAILWVPFYAVADGIVRLGRAAGAAVTADGFSPPYLAAVAYGSAVYGGLAVWIATLVARRVLGARAPVVGAATAVWIGTPLLFYMYLAPGMAHACSAFAVAAFVWTWLHVRKRWSPGGLAALGALAALMGMVREQDLFFAVGPVFDFFASAVRVKGPEAWTARARLAVAALAGAACFVVCYLPQVVAYLVVNGRVGPAPVIEAKMNWAAPYALPVLFSPHHGLFVWTPLAALAVAGLVILAVGRTSRRTSRAHQVLDERRVRQALLLMFLAQVYVSGSVETWSVAGAFGQRRFVGTTVLLVVGLSALVHVARRRVWNVAAWGAILVAVWWNLGLMAQFGAGLMDRQRLEPLRNAYTNFVVLPRLAPELAYRYLFDRTSFYRPPS